MSSSISFHHRRVVTKSCRGPLKAFPLPIQPVDANIVLSKKHPHELPHNSATVLRRKSALKYPLAESASSSCNLPGYPPLQTTNQTPLRMSSYRICDSTSKTELPLICPVPLPPNYVPLSLPIKGDLDGKCSLQSIETQTSGTFTATLSNTKTIKNRSSLRRYRSGEILVNSVKSGFKRIRRSFSTERLLTTTSTKTVDASKPKRDKRQTAEDTAACILLRRFPDDSCLIEMTRRSASAPFPIGRIDASSADHNAVAATAAAAEARGHLRVGSLCRGVDYSCRGRRFLGEGDYILELQNVPVHELPDVPSAHQLLEGRLRVTLRVKKPTNKCTV